MTHSRRTVLHLAGLGATAVGLEAVPVAALSAQDPLTPKPSPRVARFEDMAFGMFVHWGLYSQWGQGEWTMRNHGIAQEDYFGRMASFTAEDFDARAWARLARQAGMKYITLTSRHHDGFSLYDTRGLSKWDATKAAAKRDLIAEFVEGCRAESIVPMLYHTTLDWTEPRFKSDFKAYLGYLRDSVELLCTRYGEIGGFWFDGNWARKNADWEEDALYALIRKHQPQALIINNTGISKGGARGHAEIDSTTFERGRPQPIDRRGWKKYVAGEMCQTMNYHWGIATKDFNNLSPAQVIEELCMCRRAGANLLQNVGPTAQGAIPEYEAAAFRRVGEWVTLHGGDQNPIYRGRPCGLRGEGFDFALQLPDGQVYLFITELTPTAEVYAHGARKVRGPGRRRFTGLTEALAGRLKAATWMDNGEQLKLEKDAGTLTLHATRYPYGTNTVVRVAKLT